MALAENNTSRPESSAPGKACFTVASRGLDIKLSSKCSGMPTAKIRWSLGDGTQASGPTPTHHYDKAGRYVIEMQLQTASANTKVTGEIVVNDDPVLESIRRKNLPPETEHLSNPFVGADRYINPDYAKSIQASIRETRDPALISKMRSLESVPTAVWLDRIDAIYGGALNNGRSSLEEHLLRALAQQKPGTPITIELVIYNLPNRDCAALSSNGTLDYRTGGVEKYKRDYIDVIYSLLKDPRFASLRFVLILEPDSLPNMVTNLWHPKCADVAKNNVYTRAIRYAVERFSEISNAYIYMDIGHSGWLGYDDNQKATVKYFADEIAAAKTAKGLHAIDGFVTNISNFTPTEEIFLPDPEMKIGSSPLKSCTFFSWNPAFDEKRFTESLYKNLTKAGFSPNIHFLIDTSRNGWGGRNRPAGPSNKANNLNEFVDHARIDRRIDRGNWCNQSGAGLGERPTLSPFGKDHPVAALIWVKPPGESDGSSDATQSGADSEGKNFDPSCDPTYIMSHGAYPSHKPTGAMPHAPAAGHWFHEQFLMLIENAHPPVLPSSRKTAQSFPDIPPEITQTFTE